MLVLLILPTAWPTQAAPPNIIVILADDLGYADLGVQGCEDIPTPAIDSLAVKGARFTNAYVTCPICAPSRAGLITGRYQNRFGFEDNGGPDPEPAFGLPDDEVTIAEPLKAAGYRTAFIGKWDMGDKPGSRPNDQGFDQFFGFLPGVNDYLPAGHPNAYQPNDQPLVNGRSFPIYRNTQVVDEPEYLTDAFGREAAAFIEHHHDQPFLLFLSFSAVHNPMTATDRYLDRFMDLPEPRRTYAAMVGAMDDAVARVCKTLSKHDISDDTLIFFLSDNGGASGEGVAAPSPADNTPLGGRKATFWEGGIRVPYIVCWPQHIKPGQVISHNVSSLDVLPTAIAAANAFYTGKHPPDGTNLLPVLLNQTDEPPHHTLYWRYHGNAAVIQGNWKLIVFDNGIVQLFNISRDIGESTNLIHTHPEQVEQLRHLLTTWLDTLPEPAWRRRKLDERGHPAYISLPIYEAVCDPAL
jgi:arylsulfatase A-like enzyme